MSTRHEARENAVQFLFQRDFNPGELDEALAAFWVQRSPGDNVQRFAEELIRGVESHIQDIDRKLQAYADHWDVERMGGVDRNVLRLALFEILYRSDTAEGENVKIENIGSGAQDMTGWKLSDEVDTVFTFPSFTLNAGATVTIWIRSGTNTATDLYWGRDAATWNNGGDAATLKDASDMTIDTCAYAGGDAEATCN